MNDLFQALLQGGQQPTPQQEDEGPYQDPLTQLLQGMLGGQAPQGYAPEPQPEPSSFQQPMDLGGLLQGLLGGAGGPADSYAPPPQTYGPQTYSPQADAMAGQGGLDVGSLLLQALLGGGSPMASTAQAPAPSAGGLGGLLGSIMGGGSSTLAGDSFLAPIIDKLAEKLKLPPEIVQAVVAFVLGKLLQHRLQPGIDMGLEIEEAQDATPQVASLEDVVQSMNTGQRVTKAAIHDAGLVDELAEHTGLDHATAERSLQEVLNALGGELAPSQ